MINRIINNYRILKILGEGGMGIVYKAFDLQLERNVAIKILNANALVNSHFVERFKREAKNQAKLNHSNIVPVYGFIEENNLLGIVMEFVEGENLEQYIERKKTFTLCETINIITKVLSGLKYAHQMGYIHRDIKPSNILISKTGDIKIMDFGISKYIHEEKGITRTGSKVGTLLYMSPEQIKAIEPSTQSDLYSVGVILYEILSGQNPFQAKTDFEIMEAHLKRSIAKISSLRKDIPQDIDKIIYKALYKNQSRRYVSAEEFIEDLEYLNNKTTIEKKITQPDNKVNNDEKIKKSNLKAIYVLTFIFLVFSIIFYSVYSLVSADWENDKAEKDHESKSIYNNSASIKSAKWEIVSTGTSEDINAVKMVDDKIYFSSDYSICYLDTDTSFTKLFTFPGKINKTIFLNENNCISVGEKGTVYKINLTDSSYTVLFLEEETTLYDIVIFNKKIIVCGNKGKVYYSEDEGKNFFESSSSTKELLYNVYYKNNTAYVCGKNGTLLTSTDEGKSWNKIESFTNNYIKDITFLNNELGFTVGGDGEIFKTEDGGKSWTSLKSPTFYGLSSIMFIDDNNGYIAGNKGEILFSGDKGKTWNLLEDNVFIDLKQAEHFNKKIIITGKNGNLIKNF